MKLSRRALAMAPALVVLAAACTPAAPATQPPTTQAPTTQAPGTQPPAATGTPTAGGECIVGVSWNNFQQPRWAAHDEPGIRDTVEAAGGQYIQADANLSNEQQITDVETLISRGANVLVLLAQDTQAILPAVARAHQEGIPVIAYDRLIEDPDVLYITFDNVAVGRAQAEAILAAVPEGNYVLIKGDPGDPNAHTFLPQGWDEAGLKDKVDAGDITILNMSGDSWPDEAGTYTDAWATETAQDNMEAIIDRAVADGNQIDAILAENDSTAIGVVGALTAKSYGYPPLSGQDGDPANLNNVALGRQYVDVWKNARELGKAAGAAALALCEGQDMASLTMAEGLVDPRVAPDSLTAQDFVTPGDNTVKSFILKPTPITQENLQLVLDGGWVTKEQLCAGVDTSAADAPEACQ
ncbi:MAG TPA: substrate-binding domain-containing protein [Candidatus Limnocylindria bacterium]|nr:substrate-binding domain-containing protein [Candidatus Limnocylindria bacterium]